MIFANNFRTPLGIWCIYGLFCAPVLCYATSKKDLVEIFPLIDTWKYLAYSGRLISAMAETWLTTGYLSMVIERDSRARKSS